jgi:hypothetical protein
LTLFRRCSFARATRLSCGTGRGDPRFEKIAASLAPEEWGALAETETDFADGFAAEKVTEVPRIQSQQRIRPR